MEHAPLLSVTLTPYTPADAERLAQGLSVLLAEDPTLSARPGPEPDETTIGVIGELQLDIVVHRLAREFGVTAAIGRPQVEYRERVTRHAEGEIKYGRSSPAIPEYAHVKVRVAPRGAEEGNVVNDEILEGTIPAAFMPAVYEGVADALNTGVLAGYPLADVEVTIFDGTYHDVDSTASAFRLATLLAVHDAVQKARPILVQPIMRIEVSLPSRDHEDVVRGLLRRGASLQMLEEEPQWSRIYALVPLSNLFGYAAELQAETRGRGTVTTTCHCYDTVTPRDDDDEKRGGLGVREPLHPRPAPRSGHVALPLEEA